VPTSDRMAPTTYRIANSVTCPSANRIAPRSERPKPVTRLRAQSRARQLDEEGRGGGARDAPDAEAVKALLLGQVEELEGRLVLHVAKPASAIVPLASVSCSPHSPEREREKERTPVVMLSTACAASLPLKRAQTPSIVCLCVRVRVLEVCEERSRRVQRRARRTTRGSEGGRHGGVGRVSRCAEVVCGLASVPGSSAVVAGCGGAGASDATEEMDEDEEAVLSAPRWLDGCSRIKLETTIPELARQSRPRAAQRQHCSSGSSERNSAEMASVSSPRVALPPLSLTVTPH